MNFPNETKQYRAARDKLLDAEVTLRKLPAGGEIPEDYSFRGEDRVIE